MPQPTLPTLAGEGIVYGADSFESIINAYAELEQSEYTSHDENIIGDCELAVSGGNTYHFGWLEKPALMYAFYDINGDGSMELFIGGHIYEEYNSISGIYALQNGKPVSVLQTWLRLGISLSTDSDGNGVICYAWGHMGYATEIYYSLNENGELVTLDILNTGVDIGDGEWIRSKDVGGETIRITEEEYCSLIRKYGSWGYVLLEGAEAREINLEWKPVATYNVQ